MVALFGTNCVGKSTLSRALAGRLLRCAVIEVDELRHTIAGALTPVCEEPFSSEQQDEYESQWAIAESNALLLADNFARNGYSSVIDGLPQRYTEILPESLTQSVRRSLMRVGLYCSQSTLIERRRQRGWIRNPTVADCRSLKWCQTAGTSLDCSIDTGTLSIDSAADVILASIEKRHRN